MEDIDHYEIPIYNFPYDVEEDDEETITDNMELRVSRHVWTRHAVHFLILLITGSASFRCRRLRGGNRIGRWTGSRQGLSLGNRRSRQPTPLRLCQASQCNSWVRAVIHTSIDHNPHLSLTAHILVIWKLSLRTSSTRHIVPRSFREGMTLASAIRKFYLQNSQLRV